MSHAVEAYIQTRRCFSCYAAGPPSVTTRSTLTSPGPGQPRRSPMLTFATKTLLTGANGPKADPPGTSPFVRAVLKKLSRRLNMPQKYAIKICKKCSKVCKICRVHISHIVHVYPLPTLLMAFLAQALHPARPGGTGGLAPGLFRRRFVQRQ